ncbi:MAG: hypothetical protein ACTHKE_09070 [Sphingomicrobium sp.]
MQPVRPLFAAHPSIFGRAPMRDLSGAAESSRLWADLKLFALTFSAGFLFVSIVIG